MEYVTDIAINILIDDNADPSLVLIEDESVDANLFVPLKDTPVRRPSFQYLNRERTDRNANFLDETGKA